MMREASAGLSVEQIRKIRDGEAAIHSLLGEAFQEAIRNGQIAACDPVLLAHVFTSALTVRNRQPVMEQRTTTREAAAEVVDLLWHGLLPRSE